MKPDLSHLAEKHPSTIITISKIKEFTGGLINESYLANLDSIGQGPPGRFRSGRKIAYPVHEFIKWLENRSEIIERSDHAK